MSFMHLLLPTEYTNMNITTPLDGSDSIRTPNYTKEQIVEMFNNVAFGLYWMKQNGWVYTAASYLREYLTITESDVFIDDEVTSYATFKAGLDDEFFCVDFHTREVYVL